MTSRQWGVMLLLALGVMIAYADRTSIAAAIANKPFIEHFRMTGVHRGLLGSALFWSYAAAQIPAGWVVDRFGVKVPYAICFGLWCVATALSGVMTVFIGLFLMRALVGAAEAIVMPASYRWFRHNIPERHTGLAIGIFAFGNKVGTAIATPLAAWIIVNWEWQAMFAITGLAGLVWLVPWLALVKNDFPRGGQLAEAKRRAATVPFRNIITSPVVWGGIVVNFCYSYFIFYCMTWMPSYLVEQRGLSLEQSGLYTFFSFAGIAIVAVAAGWWADRLIERGADAVRTRKAFVLAGFLGAATVLFGAYTQDLGWALFWNIASLSFLGLASANNLALTKVTLIPPPAIGLVVGVQHVAAGLSGGLAASLSGWLLHVSGSYDLPIQVIVVFLAVGAASCMILLRPEWSPKVESAAAG
ncbi:MFS transporter [Novosphingobium flavum]|uniref:MFS transporter n=2 Tax=Novosphingobium flavum TaxID=1778672 RepID=A0A7X1FVB5_9SPHN|nr:MFS transporter [Novosphingobium flavum]MBC2667027.1 MFS transporter [Novosphingobium flavum]